MEELEIFNKVKFVEESHQYFVEGRELPSVSSKLKLWYPPFDPQKMSKGVMNRDDKPEYKGMTQEEILTQWDHKRETAAALGSYVHYKLEKYTAQYTGIHPRKPDFSYPFDEERAANMIKAGIKFVDAMLDKGATIVATELVMYHPTLHYAGTCDLLFKHKDKHILADWKTNQSLQKGFGKLRKPFHFLDNNPIGKYSLQLNYYKLMLEHAIPVDKMCVVHLDTTYKVYPIQDLRKLLIDSWK